MHEFCYIAQSPPAPQLANAPATHTTA